MFPQLAQRCGLAGLTLLCAAMPLQPASAAPLDGQATNIANFVVCGAAGDQTSPQIVSDGIGGAVVAWIDTRNGNSDIYAHRILNTGVVDSRWPANGAAICTATGSQDNLKIVADGAGGAFLTWEDARGSDSDIYAHHVLGWGVVNPGWPPDGLDVCTATGDQQSPQIDFRSTSGAMIVWDDARNGANDHQVFAQRVLPTGDADPAWPPQGLPVAAISPGWPTFAPMVVANAVGGAIVIYQTPDPAHECRAHHVLSDGSFDPAWGAQGVLLSSAFWLYADAISDDAGGAFVGGMTIGWPADWVNVDHILPSGAVQSVAAIGSAIKHSIEHPAIATDGIGRLVFTWTEPTWGPIDPPNALRVSASPSWIVQPSPYLSSGSAYQGIPAIAADLQGGAIVATNVGGELYVTGSSIQLHHIMSSGDPDPSCPAGGRRVSTSEGGHGAPAIVADGAGGAQLVWPYLPWNGDWDIYAYRVPGPQPTAVLVSLVSADASSDHARVVWSCSGLEGRPATIQRRTEVSEWHDINTAFADGQGYLTLVDSHVTGGTSYGYRIGDTAEAGDGFHGETWVTIPEATAFALRGLQPNPAQSGIAVAFSLPDGTPAELTVLDVTGRRVLERSVGSLGAGYHVVRFDGAPRLPAGVYFVRLTQGENMLMTRGAIVR